MEGLTTLITSFSDLVTPLLNFALWIFPVKIYRLHDGQRGVIKTYGRVRGWRGAERTAGVVICFMFEEMEVVQALGGFINLSEQVLVTKDRKVVIINGAVEYSIQNVRQAILETEDIEELLLGFCMNQIREHARLKDYEDLLDGNKLTRDLTSNANGKIQTHGTKIEKIMITDLRPHEVTQVCDTLREICDKHFPKL